MYTFYFCFIFVINYSNTHTRKQPTSVLTKALQGPLDSKQHWFILALTTRKYNFLCYQNLHVLLETLIWSPALPHSSLSHFIAAFEFIYRPQQPRDSLVITHSHCTLAIQWPDNFIGLFLLFSKCFVNVYISHNRNNLSKRCGGCVCVCGCVWGEKAQMLLLLLLNFGIPTIVLQVVLQSE